MIEQFKNMIGRSMTQVTGGLVGSDSMVFHAYDGAEFTFFHSQNCCESVSINDVVGDITDLVGSPIVEAELVSSVSNEGEKPAEYSDSWTWSFYRFATVKGTVTVRWLGESNGYYGESVAFNESLPAGVAQ